MILVTTQAKPLGDRTAASAGRKAGPTSQGTREGSAGRVRRGPGAGSEAARSLRRGRGLAPGSEALPLGGSATSVVPEMLAPAPPATRYPTCKIQRISHPIYPCSWL